MIILLCIISGHKKMMGTVTLIFQKIAPFQNQIRKKSLFMVTQV